MRLLHIIASTDPKSGGPIEGILRQHSCTHELVQREIVCSDEASAPWLKNYPIRVHALGVSRRPTRNFVRSFLQHYQYSPDLLPWLQKHLAEYDAVVVNGLWNYATWAARIALRSSKTPYVVFTHGQLDPWFSKAYPLKDFAKQCFWLINEGLLLRRAAAVAFTCKEELYLAKGRYLGHQSFNGVVLGYGTTEPPQESSNLHDAFLRRVPTLSEKKRVLLFLSRIHQKKGCDLLIEAFARIAPLHRDIDLVMAGPDQEGWGETLRKMAVEYQIADRIHWPGHLEGDAKWGAFRAAEAFILPSHSENFGIVVAESLACGTPVLISTKVNIWREVCAQGGGLTDTDTIDGTQRLLEQWLAQTPEQKRSMQIQARACYEQNFKMEHAANNLVKLLTNSAPTAPNTI